MAVHSVYFRNAPSAAAAALLLPAKCIVISCSQTIGVEPNPKRASKKSSTSIWKWLTVSFGGNRKMPAPPRHPTPPFNNLHPHDRKNTAVMGISISHMRNQSSGNHPGEQISSLHCVSINNTTIYSNEPVRVRPNPRPQKGVVRSGLVWFRKTKETTNQTINNLSSMNQ